MLGCLFAHSKATMCTYVRSQHVAFLGTWRLLYEESPISHAVQRAGWGARAGGALREGFRVGRHPSARNLTVLGITPHARAEWMLPTLTLILLVRCRFRSAAPPISGCAASGAIIRNVSGWRGGDMRAVAGLCCCAAGEGERTNKGDSPVRQSALQCSWE